MADRVAVHLRLSLAFDPLKFVAPAMVTDAAWIELPSCAGAALLDQQHCASRGLPERFGSGAPVLQQAHVVDRLSHGAFNPHRKSE